MFQLLSYFVYLIPAEAQLLHQKYLPQPMLANSEQGQPPALGREVDAPVFLVFEQFFFGQPPQHIRHRSRPRCQRRRNAVGAHAHTRLGFGQLINGF